MVFFGLIMPLTRTGGDRRGLFGRGGTISGSGMETKDEAEEIEDEAEADEEVTDEKEATEAEEEEEDGAEEPLAMTVSDTVALVEVRFYKHEYG